MKQLLLMLVLGCVNPQPVVYHPDVVSVLNTDSDKAIQVVSDERMSPHEPRKVPSSAVASALLSSGMFLDDDARVLADPIARALETMQPEETLRIVGWAADAPRYYYVLIHNGKLQILYYAGATQADSYSATLPTDAVAIAAPPPADAPHDAAPVAAPTPTPPAPTTPPQVARTTTRPKRHVAPGMEPISEAEARRRIRELDDALASGLITPIELKARRKEVLARL